MHGLRILLWARVVRGVFVFGGQEQLSHGYHSLPPALTLCAVVSPIGPPNVFAQGCLWLAVFGVRKHADFLQAVVLPENVLLSLWFVNISLAMAQLATQLSKQVDRCEFQVFLSQEPGLECSGWL